MSDIFLSYSSNDRVRVEPLHDALITEGFSVFWDVKVPPGADWDAHIRQRMSASGCAVVIWTFKSIQSDNVRHEAKIAHQHKKLISVRMDDVQPTDLPMGMYTDQAITLIGWSGATDAPEYVKLRDWIAEKLTPAWIKGVVETKDAALHAERDRREAAEAQARSSRDQIARDTLDRQKVAKERDEAVNELAKAREALAAARSRRTPWLGIVVGTLGVLCSVGAFLFGLALGSDRATPPASPKDSTVSPPPVSPPPDTSALPAEDCRLAAQERLGIIRRKVESIATDPSLNPSADEAFLGEPTLAALISCGWAGADFTKEPLAKLQVLCLQFDSPLYKWVQCDWSPQRRKVRPGLTSEEIRERVDVLNEILKHLSELK